MFEFGTRDILFMMSDISNVSGQVSSEPQIFRHLVDGFISRPEEKEYPEIKANSDSLKEIIYATLVDIAGTEEDIRLRQRTFQIMDIVNGFGDDDSFSVSSGSLPEGLDLKGSDEDIMLMLKYVDVIPAVQKVQTVLNVTSLYMEMDTTSLGYAKLFVYDNVSSNPYIRKATIDFDEKKIVSSSKFRGVFMRTGMDAHGPCISDGSFDFAICLHATKWPEIALDRLKNCTSDKWLTADLKKELISKGCVYVPVGPRNAEDYDKLWRISFALSERQLTLLMSYPQMLCYALLKIILKEAINKKECTKELLCSYFMKTCMFWIIEETNNDETTWSKENLFDCFIMCIERITEWVSDCNCPNYFIPQNNMFSGRIYDENKLDLLKVLNDIKENGYTSLLRCESFVELLHCKKTSNIEREANLDILCYRVMHIYPFDNMTLLQCALDTMKKLYESESHSFIKGVIRRFQSSMHQEMAQMIQDAKKITNIRYTQKQHILNSCGGDVCCGYILLASFHHVQGHHYTALEILNTTLQKLSPDMLQSRKSEYSHEEKKRYMKAFCGRGLTLEQKMREATINNIVLLDNSSIVPKEFQPEVEHCRPLYVMPPVVYAHSIKFLCYYHLNDEDYKAKALQQLEEVVMEKQFVLDRHYLNALTILGACYETNGDVLNAKRCYILAIDNPHNCQSVKVRLKRLEEKAK